MRSPAARAVLPVAVMGVVLLAGVAIVPAYVGAQAGADGGSTIAIDLGPGGDARVTVVHELELSSAAEVEAFDRLAEEHVSGATPRVSIGPFERAVDGAAEVTGRQMAIRDVSRTANRENRTGRLSLSFTWTAFARVDEDRLVVGDAFRSPRGTWLPRLGAGQELIITFPPGYAVQSVSRPLEDGEIHIVGPATFEPGNPSAVLTGSPAPWWSGNVPILAGGVVIFVLVVGGLYRYRDRLRPLTDGSADQPTAGTGQAEEAVEGEAVADPDGPLLSDEERVLRLLDAEGGRMKQVDIVEATDWSNAKVSQLLSEMEEAGRIDKLRIGRENLISLPGEGPGDE